MGKILGKQLLRSGTAVGANVHEAQGGQSRADFIAKMSIAYKEALESQYWIRLIAAAELITIAEVGLMKQETLEIVKILSSILISSKSLKKTASK